MILVQPVAGVVEHELPYLPTVHPIVVQGIAPWGAILATQILRGELQQIIALRSQVVVYHVQNDPYPMLMGCVHEAFERCRAPVVGTDGE